MTVLFADAPPFFATYPVGESRTTYRRDGVSGHEKHAHYLVPHGLFGLKNQGAYVSCVAQASQEFVRQGLITGAEKGALVSAAAQSLRE